MSRRYYFAGKPPTLMPPLYWPETSGLGLLRVEPREQRRGVGERCDCPRDGNPYSACAQGLTCVQSPLDGPGAGRCQLRSFPSCKPTLPLMK